MNTKSKSAQQMGVLSPKISYKAYLKGLQSEVEASRVAVVFVNLCRKISQD